MIMGSGETAPTMVRTHRQVLADTYADGQSGPAVLLDTPFGFQVNADELVARTLTYFADSVGQQLDVGSWRRRDAPTAEREGTLALLQRARWVFAGPGSPTYALRQWRDTPLPAALADVAQRGGTVVVGSAAAVTVGMFAVPVYEIYKAGADPEWASGLDLLRQLTGIPAVVVPHYDNREGGSYDTRFCYLGEERLSRLEADLPEDVGVLGVDEHTALLLDLTAGTATVAGSGVVTVRRRGDSRLLDSGTVLSIDELRDLLRAADGAVPVVAAGHALPVPAAAAAPPGSPAPASLREAADHARALAEESLEQRDAAGCAAAILDLESALSDWRADTLQSDDAEYARRVLRSLVVRLGELAQIGVRDPAAVLGPFVELLLEWRAQSRAAKDFATADRLRDRLDAAGVEVRDTPGGMTWQLRG